MHVHNDQNKEYSTYETEQQLKTKNHPSRLNVHEIVIINLTTTWIYKNWEEAQKM